MDRTILHVDMDAFFAAVEVRDRPELRGKPVVIGAAPNERGVVAAASYEARRYGIHSAMPSREAGKRCPHAIFLPPDFRRYEQASRQVFRIFERFTPHVEPLSIDEAFLDVTGARRMFGTGPQIAEKLRSSIHTETGLTASVGIAPNKFLAKLASEINKPDGVTVVPQSQAKIREFLAPLPVGRLWGVGKVSRELLERRGVRTIGDVHAAGHDRLARILGETWAAHLVKLASGEDDREVCTEYEEKSISREHTFPKDCADEGEVEETLCDLAEDVGRRLRKSGKYARVGHLKLRWKGFETITRQRPFVEPCNDTFRLVAMAREFIDSVELVKAVRLVGFGVSGFVDKAGDQLDLFDARPRLSQKREQLSRTVDSIRERFGDESIRRGASLKKKSGLSQGPS